MKEQFYPNWIKNKRIIQQKKQFKNLCALCGIFIFISLINVYNTAKEIYEYKVELKNNFNDIEVIVEEDSFITVGIFEVLMEGLGDNIQRIKHLNIEENTINLEIYADTLKEYGEIIKLLEGNFIIEEVSSLQDIGEKGYFKVRMKSYEIT